MCPRHAMFSDKKLALLQLLFILAVALAQKLDQTKECNDGRCIPLHECTLALNRLYQKDNEFVKNISCGFIGTQPMVCCPNVNNEHITFVNESSSATIKPITTPSSNTPNVSTTTRTFAPLTPPLHIHNNEQIVTSTTDRNKPSAPTLHLDPAPVVQVAPVFNPLSQQNNSNLDYNLEHRAPPVQERHPVPTPNGSFPSKEQSGYSITLTSNLLPSTDVCGPSTSLADKIVGGETTAIDEYPWMVRLKIVLENNKVQYGCGGSLISNQYVLTAAHCIRSGYEMIITLGEWDEETEKDCSEGFCNDPPVDIRAEEIIQHPGFDRSDRFIKDDIALIRLQRPVNYTEWIRPICMPLAEPAENKNNTGSIYWTAGWGLTEFGSTSSIKRKVQVSEKDVSVCRQNFNIVTDYIVPRIICAGGREGSDSCAGDSGGPLMKGVAHGRQYNWYLNGIVSFGHRLCGSGGRPSIYTRVAFYRDWILERMRP